MLKISKISAINVVNNFEIFHKRYVIIIINEIIVNETNS